MRLADDKIRAGLLHDERFVRDATLGYFSTSMSEDRHAMHMATQAVDRFGWENAFSDLEMLQGLVQSDESIDWILAQFRRFKVPKTLGESEYLTRLSGILAFADPGLLKRRRKDWADLRYLAPSAAELIKERTLLLSLGHVECWRQLESFCRSMTVLENEVDGLPDRIFALIETVSRSSHDYRPRVLEILNEEVAATDRERHWLQTLMVTMAGQLRFHDAVPQIIARIQNTTPAWLMEEAAIALTRINGDRVVKGIWNGCALGDAEFRQVAAWVLQGIHTDLALEALLQLLQNEQDAFARFDQAQALLSQFAIDGIGPVRQLVLSGRLDGEQALALQYGLLAVCTLLDAHIPELDGWLQEYRSDQQRRAAYQTPDVQVEGWIPPVSEFDAHVPSGPAMAVSSHQESAGTRLASAEPFAKDFRSRAFMSSVGRNDPCPCQSGRKYKHCCLRK